MFVVGDVGRTVKQGVMGPLTCPQSYRRFITAHWARKKYRIQSIRGFTFLWDQWAVGYTLAVFIHLLSLFTCFLIVSSCAWLSPSYCFLHSLTQHTLKKKQKKKHMEIVYKGIVISLAMVSLMGSDLLSIYYETPQKYPIFLLCSFFKIYQGFSSLNVPKKKNKLSWVVWLIKKSLSWFTLKMEFMMNRDEKQYLSTKYLMVL